MIVVEHPAESLPTQRFKRSRRLARVRPALLPELQVRRHLSKDHVDLLEGFVPNFTARLHLDLKPKLCRADCLEQLRRPLRQVLHLRKIKGDRGWRSPAQARRQRVWVRPWASREPPCGLAHRCIRGDRCPLPSVSQRELTASPIPSRTTPHGTSEDRFW